MLHYPLGFHFELVSWLSFHLKTKEAAKAITGRASEVWFPGPPVYTAHIHPTSVVARSKLRPTEPIEVNYEPLLAS